MQYALTAIKGVGRRFSNVVCKKAEIDLYQRYVRRPFISFLPPSPVHTFMPRRSGLTTVPINPTAPAN